MVFLKCKQCGEEFEWRLNTKYFRHICKKCGQASEYNLDSSAELILESSSNEEQTSEEQTLIQRFEEKDQGSSFKKYYDEMIKYAPIKYVNIKDLQLDEKLQKVIEGQTTGSGTYKGVYEYQKETYDKIIKGKNVAITAPTGSGKTLSFLMPIIQRIINKGAYKKLDTIVVSPIKALTNDQYEQIKRFAEPCGITVGIHTGDLLQKQKIENLTKSPEILCTNFDSIYYNLLRNSQFATLFHNFNTIVVDELHYYSGVHGSNIHHLLSVLKRNNPKLQMVGASATIDNLDKFAKKLFNNTDVEIIKTDQKNGQTNFVIIAPKGISFTTLLMNFCKQLKKWDKQFLIFWDSKTGVEKFAWRAEKDGLKIEPHRAGLKPHERKEIEDGLKSKKLAGLIATPTLELGIDIGSIEVVFSILVPWSQFKQRMGRAGRRGQLGTGILILGDDPVAEWFKKHPKDYQTPHIVHINPDNRRVSKYMFPYRVLNTSESKNNLFTTEEKHYKRNESIFLQKKLFSIKENLLRPNEGGQIKGFLENYNIRSMGGDVKIYEKPFDGFTGKYTSKYEIGVEQVPLAYQRFHVGYIYLHKRKEYEIIETHMNPQDESPTAEHYVVVQKKKYVSPKPLEEPPVPYYTKTQYLKDPTILDDPEPKKVLVGGMQILHAELDIDKTVFSFGKFNLYNDDPIEQNIPVDGETFKFQTKGVVLPIPIIKENCRLEIIEERKMGPIIKDDVTEGLHAIEHLLQSAGITVVGMSLQDLDGIYENNKSIKCPLCKGDIYTIVICPHCKSENVEVKDIGEEKGVEDGEWKHERIEMLSCHDCKNDFRVDSILDNGYKCNSCKKLFSSFKEMEVNRKIYIYDDSGDGESGVTEAIYHNIEETLRRAFEMVSTKHYTKDGEMCVAENGCNNCTFLMLKCQEFNENLSKPEAIKTLEIIVSEIFKQKLEKIRYEKSSEEITKIRIQELREKYEKLLNVKKEIDELEDEINDEY